MKPYFAKYLPVEGEILKGDMAFVVPGSSLPPTLIKSDGSKTNPKEDKKAQLFLCSRDIQVGDHVKIQGKDNQLFNKTVLDFRELVEGEKEVLLSSTFDMWSDSGRPIRVIGPISSDAIWVKEGDEFEEDDCWVLEFGSSVRRPLSRIRNEFKWDGKSTEYPKIYLPCPTCGALH